MTPPPKHRGRVGRRLLLAEVLESRRLLAGQNLLMPTHVWQQLARHEIEARQSIEQVGSVAVADVDRDGDLDVVTTLEDSLRVFLADGAGGFVPFDGENDLRWLEPGMGPGGSMASGDVNGDGYVDLMASNRNGIRLFLNLGVVDGIWAGFDLQVDGIDLPNTWSLLLDDLNADGLLDLVTTTSAGLQVRLGAPAVQFGEPTSYGGSFPAGFPGLTSVQRVAIHDVDRDGDLDIVRAGDEGILRNDGSGYFEPTGGALLSDAIEVTLADINGDRAADLILVRPDDAVSISLNDGFGNFSADLQRYPVPHGVTNLAVGDFDGDGDQDLLVSQRAVAHAFGLPYWEHGGIDLTFLNAGNGQFQSPVMGMNGPNGPRTVLHVNGQDQLLNFWEERPATLTIATYGIRASSIFAETVHTFVLEDPDLGNAATLVNVNDDGRPDALIDVRRSDHLFTLTLQADGQFAVRQMNADQSPHFAVVDDVTGDGKADVVTGMSDILVYPGETFDNVVVSEDTAAASLDRLAADLNRDGLRDLVAFRRSPSPARSTTIYAAFNQGGGHFATSVEVGNISSTSYWLVRLQDPDDLRLIVLEEATGTLLEHSFLADGTLSAANPLLVEHPGQILGLADLNGDGHVDLITSSADGRRYETLRTQDAGPFGDGVILNHDGVYSPPIDVDRDGLIDHLLNVRSLSLLSYDRNKGDGILESNQSFPYPFPVSDAALADLDQNGYWDTVYAIHQPKSSGGGLIVVYDSEHGPLRSEFILFSQSGLAGPARASSQRTARSSLQVSDIDGDGDEDIVTAGWRGASVLMNETAQRFTAGDLNRDGQVNIDDVDAICRAVLVGVPNAAPFDWNRSGTLDRADVASLVRDVFQTGPGDANLDGRFDSADLVTVFQQGAYNDITPAIASWRDGDWNCDGRFDSQDLVQAFIAGTYEG